MEAGRVLGLELDLGREMSCSGGFGVGREKRRKNSHLWMGSMTSGRGRGRSFEQHGQPRRPRLPAKAKSSLFVSKRISSVPGGEQTLSSVMSLPGQQEMLAVTREVRAC
ncbi:unnamed protein product [Phaeothamnion confervicola]